MNDNLNDKPYPYVECKKCKTPHFEVPTKYVTDEVDRFNAYYVTLPDEAKSMFGGPSDISRYKKCKGCGGSYRNFQEHTFTSRTVGQTINPILRKSE